MCVGVLPCAHARVCVCVFGRRECVCVSDHVCSSVCVSVIAFVCVCVCECALVCVPG